jgi:hypothetical protein
LCVLDHYGVASGFVCRLPVTVRGEQLTPQGFYLSHTFPFGGAVAGGLGVAAGNATHRLFSPEPGADTVLEGGDEGCTGSDPSYFPDGNVDEACAGGDYYSEAGLDGRLCGADDDVSKDRGHTCGGQT